MGMKLFDVHGVALDEQTFSWREMAGQPISKLDDDALTRVRIILMSSIEAQSLHFQHACASMNSELRAALATVRRVEHHQQTLLNWLLSPDHSPLEVTVAHEQAAIEVLAALAQQEVDPYLAQVYRFVLLEDCDHLYRLAALMDRVEGRDANNILQSYTDIRPGRPTPVQHSHPSDDLRTPYQRSAVPSSKLHVRIAMALKNQTRDHYLAAGPTRADPMARRLYAEIASVEEQHATQFTSLVTSFANTTARDLETAVQSLRESAPTGLHGLVLDLRNNPGGVLEAAVAVADLFLDEGLIVRGSGRARQARFERYASEGDLLEDVPLVVLVNGGSASASEIVAGALKDHGRAALVGTKTYGKGSVQTVMPIGEGSAIKLTTSLYITPSGAVINGVGIEPDLAVKMASPKRIYRGAGGGRARR